jgi:hypothetical protein
MEHPNIQRANPLIRHKKPAVHLPAIFRFSFGTNRAIRLLRVSGGESPEGWVGERTAPPARFFACCKSRRPRQYAGTEDPWHRSPAPTNTIMSRAKTL